MEASKKKLIYQLWHYLLWIGCGSIAVAMLWHSYGSSVYLKIKASQAGGFGITPPYIQSHSLKAGDTYIQEISVMRTDVSGSGAVKIYAVAPELKGWVDVLPASIIDFKPGEWIKNVKVRVRVPDQAAPGKYQGRVFFVNLPRKNEKGVAINIGARADINIKVNKK